MIHAPKFPLRFKEQKGFENVSGLKELVRFHMINILLTHPGEKISDPNFGVGVRSYLFENITEGLVNNMTAEVEEQLATYIPSVSVESTQVTPFPEENKLILTITYNIDETKEKDVLNLELSSALPEGPVY